MRILSSSAARIYWIFMFFFQALGFWSWFCTLFFFIQAGILSAQPNYKMANTVEVERLLHEVAALCDNDKYKEALTKLDTAKNIWEVSIGMEDTTYANILHQFGRCYLYEEKPDSSIKYNQKALDIRLKKLEPEHPDVARSYGGLGGAYYLKGDYNQALEYHREALSILLKKLGPAHRDVGNTYGNLGIDYYIKGEYEQAMECFQKALEILLKIDPEHLYVANAYNNLGLSCQSLSNYNGAIQYYEEALKVLLKKSTLKYSYVAISYNGLGEAYEAKGSYERAIQYYLKALDIQLKKLNPGSFDIQITYNSLGNVYYEKNDYNRAIQYYQKALDLALKNFDPEHPEVAVSYNNLGNVYHDKGDDDRAIEYHQKALKIRLEKLHPEHIRVASSYNNLGNAYRSKGGYDQAMEYYHKALAIKLKKLSLKHPSVALSYGNISNIYYYKGDYDCAIEYRQKSLDIQLEALGSEHPEVATSYGILSEIYNAKGDYTISVNYCKEAIAVIKAFRTDIENPGTTTTLEKKDFQIFESAIGINLLLYRLTDSLQYLIESFDYAEQSKAQNLYEAVKNAEALSFSGIPDSLLKQEYDLRVNISYNDKRRHNLLISGKSEIDTMVLAITSKLFELRSTYEILINTFETHYPDYYHLKYDFSTVSTRVVQDSLLEEGQTLLEYVMADSTIFVFIIRKDTLVAVELKKNFPLDAWVDSLRISVAEEYITKVKDYCDWAYLLYQKLLLPLEGLLTEKLILIPDGKLNYLPFEALLTALPNNVRQWKTHPYLLRKHQISYCYSARLLREMRNKQHLHQAEKPLLAMAPCSMISKDLGKQRELTYLPNSGEEVCAIQQIMGGDVVCEKEATKEYFIALVDSYRVLHLALHGQASPDTSGGDYSFLAFAECNDSTSQNLLYVRDIYNLMINADLAVLSACETGIGQYQLGEGVISLARAFAYAGAKSIVTSLWTLEDAATKDIMVRFYQQLQKGLSKDDALRQAKLEYIDSQNVYLNAHPFFWAGFVPIGDMRAVFVRK